MTAPARPAVRHAEEGLAMIVAILATLVVSGLSVAMILGGSIETMMAANFQTGVEAQYAAAAALNRAAAELPTVADWNLLLSGPELSSFADGVPTGTRTLADGAAVDLGEIVNLANCGRPRRCAAADLVATHAERPWGRNNPQWRLYAYGRLQDMIPAHVGVPSFYVVVLVGDDPLETDGQPLADGAPPIGGEPDNPGRGVLMLRSEAFGPRGAHARAEGTVQRASGLIGWRAMH